MLGAGSRVEINCAERVSSTVFTTPHKWRERQIHVLGVREPDARLPGVRRSGVTLFISGRVRHKIARLRELENYVHAESRFKSLLQNIDNTYVFDVEMHREMHCHTLEPLSNCTLDMSDCALERKSFSRSKRLEPYLLNSAPASRS